DLLGAAALFPEVDAADVIVCPPERAVMIVIGRRWMAHARHRAAGGADEGKKKGPGEPGAEMPAQPLLALDLERYLVVGLRHDLPAWEKVGGNEGSARVARRNRAHSRNRVTILSLEGPTGQSIIGRNRGAQKKSRLQPGGRRRQAAS